MRTTETHVYFWGSYLSNFWLAPIVGTPEMARPLGRYVCSEQVYMIEKAAYFGDNEIISEMFSAPDGRSVKALGRTVKGFDAEEWGKVSYGKMLIACRAKFVQNNLLGAKLWATGNLTLVEASPMDNIWGVGLHEDDDKILNEVNWTGKNWLGKVLMDVREELKEKVRERVAKTNPFII